MNAGLLMMLFGAAMMFAAPTIRLLEVRHHAERPRETATRAD